MVYTRDTIDKAAEIFTDLIIRQPILSDVPGSPSLDQLSFKYLFAVL